MNTTLAFSIQYSSTISPRLWEIKCQNQDKKICIIKEIEIVPGYYANNAK